MNVQAKWIFSGYSVKYYLKQIIFICFYMPWSVIVGLTRKLLRENSLLGSRTSNHPVILQRHFYCWRRLHLASRDISTQKLKGCNSTTKNTIKPQVLRQCHTRYTSDPYHPCLLEQWRLKAGITYSSPFPSPLLINLWSTSSIRLAMTKQSI